MVFVDSRKKLVEYFKKNIAKGYTVEEFLAAGIIRLYNERLGSKRQRAIEIIKMRGINHKRGVFPLSITDNGIVISPEVEMLS